MHCSTVIVSYNTFDLTVKAVRTALSAAEGIEHEVVVVDNNSPDGSAARLQKAFPRSEFPNVRVMANSDNPGFASANNQGAGVASGEVLFFLNPDTEVHGDAIRVLYDFLSAHPEAGAAGPHVLNTDGTDQASTFPFITPRYLIWHHLPFDALLSGSDQRDDYVPERTEKVDIVKGCALAIRRDVFDEVNGWDESYFMYNEETELCYALAKKGYTNYFVREATITHLGGASSLENYAEQQVVHARSVLQFLVRHRRRGLIVLNRVAGTLGFAGRAVIFAILARLRGERAQDYRRRGQAASRLLRWYIGDYSQ
jgi:GT2 family glycosyltransferase